MYNLFSNPEAADYVTKMYKDGTTITRIQSDLSELFRIEMSTKAIYNYLKQNRTYRPEDERKGRRNEEILSLYYRSMITAKEIANVYRITEAAVYAITRKGITQSEEILMQEYDVIYKLLRQGSTFDEIVAITEFPIYDVYFLFRKLPTVPLQKLRRSQKESIVRDFYDGIELADIMWKYHCSAKTIYDIKDKFEKQDNPKPW